MTDIATIWRSRDWNNGQPGGAEGWVIYFDEDKAHPYFARELDSALKCVRGHLETPPAKGRGD